MSASYQIRLARSRRWCAVVGYPDAFSKIFEKLADDLFSKGIAAVYQRTRYQLSHLFNPVALAPKDCLPFVSKCLSLVKIRDFRLSSANRDYLVCS